MLHAGCGRSWGHHNRKPQGGGTPTPTPSVGNQLKPANRAQAQTMLSTSAVAGDVIDCRGAWYSPDTGGVFNVTRGMGAGAGVTFLAHATEPSQYVATGIANMYIEFVAGIGSSYAAGKTPGAPDDRTFMFTNCTHFAIHGFNVGRGNFGGFIDTCSDYDISNNNFYDCTDDLIRITGTTNRARVDNNYLMDVITGSKFWGFTNGTAPSFYNDPGGSAFNDDPNHNDPIQVVTGSATVYSDVQITNNKTAGWMQGLWMVAEFNTFHRWKVSGNDITPAFTNALSIGSYIDNVEVSSNIVRTPPSWYPGVSTHYIILNDNNNTGPFKTDGLNVFTAGFTSLINPAINLINGVASGSATAPTAPGFTGTTSNISNLVSLRNRPSYTPYAGGISVPAGLTAKIWGPGGALSSYPGNAVLTVNPPYVRGRTANCEDSYQTRWKSSPGGTIVQAAGTGRTYMVFTAPSAGGSFYAEVNVGDGVWVASNTVSVAAAFSVFQTGMSLVTYSNGNQTITKDAGSDTTDRNGRSTNAIPAAAGDYVAELTCTAVSGGGANLGLTDNTDGGNTGNFLDFNGSGWYYNGSNRGWGGSSAMDGSQKNMLLIRRSGAGGSTIKLFHYQGSTNGWLAATGDPNGAGAGQDISSYFTGPIFAKCRVTKVGEIGTINCNPANFGTTVPSGAVPV